MRKQKNCRSLLRIAVQSILILCILMLIGTTAEASCRLGCSQSDDGFLKFMPGNAYEYNFDSIMTVGINGGSGSSDDTSLKIIGNAKVFAEGNCGYTLQLDSIKVTATKESVEKKIIESIQRPVHFTMVGGKIEPELCIENEDHAYALNIKRAVVSMLQSKPDVEQEVDIFGQCATHTTVTKFGNTVVVNKVRNLNTCAYREIINSGLLTNAVKTKSGQKTTSGLKADYSKELNIENGVVSTVKLVEEYKYTAVPKSDIGVRAKVVTNLKLKNVLPGAAPATGSRNVSIIFQQPETYPSKNIASLKNALTELVHLLNGYVKTESAKGFVELIRLMRNSDTETLLELGAFPLPNKVVARNAYLDALFRTATSESARAILRQFNKMIDKEKTIAMLSLNLVQTVDKETLNEAAALLNPNAFKEVYLAVGGLVSKYCDINGCESGEVDAISKKFTESLKNCKANTKKDEERIIYILKGIGNTHYLASSVASSLTECAAKGRSNRIRVVALQSFSAKSCDSTLKQKAMEILADRNEDSEVRIEAFLTAINCPSGELANEIADIVNTETVTQVGGFIASSLRAIRDSTDESREKQRQHLGNIRITKHFLKDFRRYSYNNEVSYKIEALGMSASTNCKLIYSQNGFLPRSARLNVKAEEFGFNMNVLDASIRQENLENVLEYFLGPKGMINKDLSEILGKVDGEKSDRKRRSIADDTAKVAKKYKSYAAKSTNDLNFDVSLKLFGSEMLFLSMGDNIPSAFDDIMKQVSIAFDKVKKQLKSYNKEFTSHNFIMDSEILYPTGVGIPLELSSQGFAANKIDFGVSVDVDGLMQSNWYNSEYKLKLEPSIDVNINLKVGFNAHVLSSGLRSIFSMHSATGSSIVLTFTNEGTGFNMNMELPREKMQLIDLKMQNDFYVAEQDKAIKPLPLKDSKHNAAAPAIESCYNQFDSLGFSPCIVGSFSDLNQENGFSQPFDFSVYITTERNINLKGYHNTQKTGVYQWKLDYSTPKSKESHDTSLTLEFGTEPRIYGRASLENSIYHFGVETGFNNDNNEMILYVQYEQESDVKKSKIGFIKNGNEFKPVIEIQDANGGTVHEINGYRVDGRVLVKKTGDQSKFHFENLQVSNPDNDPIVVNGWAELGPASLSTDLHVAPNENCYLIKSYAKVSNGEYALGLFVNDEKSPENIYGASTNIHIGDQLVNVDLLSKFAKWELSAANKIEFIKQNGPNPIASSKFLSSVSINHKNNVIGTLKVNGLTEGQNKFEINAEATSGKKAASAVVKYTANQNAQNDYQLSVNTKLNQHFINIMSKCDLNGNHFVLENILTTSGGSAFILKGELGQRYTAQDIFMDLQGTAQISSKDIPTQWVLKVLGSPEKTISEFKVTRHNTELLKVSADTQHPHDKITSAKFNVILKNILAAKGDIKIAKNGKGEITSVVETLKTEPKRKVNLNSKFHIQHPKYDVQATIVLDGEQKVFVSTENIMDKLKLSTKNVIDIAQKKVLFDGNSIVKGDWRLNGEILSSFSLTCPEGRIVTGLLKRMINTNGKTGIAQGTMDLQLDDQLSSGGNKRSIVLATKLEKFNIKAKEVGAISSLIYTNFEGKQMEANCHIKNLPKGQYKNIDFQTTVKGNLIKSPIELTVNLDEYSAHHAIFSFGGKYGEEINANINGNLNLGERNSLIEFELNSDVQLPQTSFRTIDFISKGQFMQPQTKGGYYIFELFVDEKVGSDQFFKINTNIKSSEGHGNFSINVETKKMKTPLQMDVSYQRDQQGSIRGNNASGSVRNEFNFHYADKFVKCSNDLTYSGKDMIINRLDFASNFEVAKNVYLEVQGKLVNSDTYNLNVVAKHNEHSYSLDSTLYQGNHKKGIKMNASLPNGIPIGIVILVDIMGPRKTKVTMELSNIVDLDFIFNSEASYNGADDFYIIAHWHSIKLNLDNYNLNVKTEDKGISFELNNAQGKIFSSSATCGLKTENKKNIVECQGQIQYKGTNHNSNFRLTRQVYEIATDEEFGVSYNFNGNVGTKNGVSTLKITNKDFNVKLSICEEKKQCTNIQFFSSNNFTNEESSIHSLLVLVDLRELGFPYEFELQSKNVRNGFKFQYMMDSNIISNNNLKYNFLANIQPKNIKVQLKIPSREILLESQQKFPTNGQIYGHYENSLAFYIDKTNKPQDITRFTAQADITGEEYVAIHTKGLLKLEHPTIRPLSVSGQMDANRVNHIVNAELICDVFKLPEQKVIANIQLENMKGNLGFNITSCQVLRSTGLGFEYTLNGHIGFDTKEHKFSCGADMSSIASELKTSAFLFANREHAEIIINSLNEDVLKMVADFNKQRLSSKFNAQLQLMGQKPIEIYAELQPTMAKLNFKCEGLMNAQSEVKVGKEFMFQVEGFDKDLLSGRVGLDAQNFLRTIYNINEVDIQEFISLLEIEIKKDSENTREVIKQRFKNLKQIRDRQLQLAKESVLDLSNLRNSYHNNINQIVKELENDPAMKQISETLQNLYAKISKLATELTNLWIGLYDEMYKSFISLYEKFETIIKESALPAWEEFTSNSDKILRTIRIELFEIYSNVFQTLLEVLKKYEPVMKNYGKVISEVLKPLNESVQELYRAIKTAIEEMVNEWIEYFNKLPSFDTILKELREKMERLKLGEKALELINNVVDHINVFPLTPESSELLNKVHEYILAKLKHQPIDDEKFIEDICKLFIKTVRSILVSLEMVVPTGTSLSRPSLSDLFVGEPISIELFLPALLTLRFSVFNFLINEDWENWFKNFYLKPWLFSHNFALKGHVTDGRHLFTFDGQHLSFIGNCKYILAQDSVDNNFTVIALINNGKMKSIFLTDREGKYMEINDGGVLKVNGNAVEFPHHDSEMHSWRMFYTIYMVSEYGVRVMCTTDLKICHVDVNGFYTSKVRGLLGNGNAEPYDDFVQIDGVVAADVATFVNGYGLGKCNPATVEQNAVDTTTKRSEICNEIFGYESPLAVAFFFMDYKPYRIACDQSVFAAAEKDKENAACLIATAYASAVKLEDMFVVLPTRCLKCAGAAGQREVGDVFSLKVPTNKADIVFVVDLDVTPIVMRNMVGPVVKEVRDTLKARGFSDVHIAVVAYSANQRYPAILTSDNGKLNYQGNLAEVSLNGPKPIFESNIAQMITEKKVLDIFELFEGVFKNIIPKSDEMAFRMALDYPFRAAAAKSIIAVRSNNFEYDNMLKLVRAHLLGAVTQFDAALLHVIEPVTDMSLDGVSTEKLVGFNSRLIATLDGKDAKKRAKLQFHNDMGTDFVLNNGGWVFSTQNFVQLKPQEQKKAVNQITNALADTLFKTEIMSECCCLPVHGIHVQHKCVIKSSNFVPNKKIKA